MKRNIFYLIVSILAVALVIALPFAFVSWNKALVNNGNVLPFYIIAKVLYGLCLVIFAVLIFVKEQARGHALFILVATGISQFIPLLMRLGLNMGGFALIYEILMLIIPLMLYVAFLGLVFVSSRKQLNADKKYEGRTIEVYDEKD